MQPTIDHRPSEVLVVRLGAFKLMLYLNAQCIVDGAWYLEASGALLRWATGRRV